MAWFGKGADEPRARASAPPDDAEPAALAPVVSASVVFHPEPQRDDLSPAQAKATAPALEWTVTARVAPAKVAPRTPLQEQMAKIAKKYKDAPIEDMAKPIREALAANGREVPDDWILAIAEGLRQHGPISLNLGGPGPARS